MNGGLRSALLGDLERHAFAAAGTADRRIGAEAELIPVELETGRRCPLDEAPRALLPFLRRWGARQGWTEDRTAKGAPCFLLPEGGDLTFEPGGQLEYSSPPCRSPSALLALLRGVITPLRTAAESEGITLLAIGLDPVNRVEQASLVLRSERYLRMAEYFARRGPAGARMMRQTASLQINLDIGAEPWLRWRVLNAAAPYFVAIFANSPFCAGADAGCASARAQVWRAVDPARTGLPWRAHDPVGRYLDFALDAPALFVRTPSDEHPRFRDWAARCGAPLEPWHEHLTTLFPEVRPRGHFELRSTDALAPEWYAAPLALATGLIYDPTSLRAAADLLGEPDPALLDRAGRLGLRDSTIARTAQALTALALEGCERLGAGYFHPADLGEARAFFERFTWCGRSPADELRPPRGTPDWRTNVRSGTAAHPLQTVRT